MNNKAPFSLPVTLANCEDEPIHVPGAIQPHGVLLALEGAELRIEQLSANTEAFFGKNATELLGHGVHHLFDDAGVAALEDAKGRPSLRDVNPIRLTTREGGERFDGILHRSGDFLVLELERASSPEDLSFGTFYRRVRNAVARLRETMRVNELAVLAAEEVRALTGFDRVMVYQFAADDSGEVIAEAKRDDIESFFGLHYPASDIPAQARRLYTINWLRLIADIAYTPVPILARPDSAARGPLDQSHSVLRSVSPIHVEYLSNMGVGASMSISLVVDGKLWGLVACHHYAPKFVSYEVRAACEFLGEALSWQVAARERSDLFEKRAASQRILARLVEHMSMAGPHIGITLTEESSPVLALVGAEGVAIRHQHREGALGVVPPKSELNAFARWLPLADSSGVFVSNAITVNHPDAPPLHGVAGVIAIQASKEAGDYFLWFRSEVIRTVNWGGDPNKTLDVRDGVARLSPRGSFALWKETVKGRAPPWESWQTDAARELRLSILGGIQERAAELARLNEELRASNFAKDEFLATVSHELRTPLNAMLGYLRLMETGQLPMSKRQQAMETITRNARVQAQLVEDLLDISRIISGKMRLDVQPVEPLAVVEAAIEAVQPAADAKAIRIQPILDPKAGPVIGDPSRLQQVVWNLLTNAVKFTPKNGRIQIRLRRVGSSVEIGVVDSGDGIEKEFLPHVFERFRQQDGSMSRTHKGLGLGLAIAKQLVELHGGTVDVDSQGRGKGAEFVVRLPLSATKAASTSNDRHPATSEPASAFEPPPRLRGLRVLTVDDEPDANELLRTVLQGCGIEVTTTGSAAEVLEILPQLRPDVLVSDIGMPEMDGFELIRRIRELPSAKGGRTPAIAVTAFARTEDRQKAFLSGFDAYLPKPIDPAELVAMLASMANRFATEGAQTSPSSPSSPSSLRSAPPVDGALAMASTVSIPAPPPAPSAPAPASLYPKDLNGVRVLAVDDDEDSVELYAHVLTRAGAEVRTATTAAQAFDTLRSFRPDVLLSNLGLPDESGLALLRKVRALGSAGGGWVPAIALTGKTAPEDAHQALLAGFQLHLSKPVLPETLLSNIAKLASWRGGRG